MGTRARLEERIQTEIEKAARRMEEVRREAGQESEALSDRYEMFEAISKRLVSDPRAGQLKRLADMFDNAQIERSHDYAGYRGVVAFRHTPKFPARVRLRMAMVHDAEVRNVLLTYDLEITPVFIQFQRHDQIAFPLDKVDSERLFEWADDKIIQFVRTYMELEFADQYQKENLVTDPVLRERFSRILSVGEVEYEGHAYFFLTHKSKDMFEKEPARFVSAEPVASD